MTRDVSLTQLLENNNHPRESSITGLCYEVSPAVAKTSCKNRPNGVVKCARTKEVPS